MKIVFLGKLFDRMSALAQEAQQNGHKTVLLQNNGFVENIKSLLNTIRIHPNTIHVHGINSALLFVFYSFFISKNITAIWTIDQLPTGITSRFLSIIIHFFDRICVPTRTLQYRLLTEYGIKSFHIPDGYTKPILQDIAPRIYGLRVNQFGVILSNSLQEITTIATAYKTTKSKKKLVVFAENPSAEFKKLQKTHPFLITLPLPHNSRGAISMVRSAGFIIMADHAFSNILLQAMDTNRVVIATTQPLHEEILGLTGFYYSHDDTTHLEHLLHEATIDKLLPKYSPSTRAQHHFTWEKAGLEYEQLYSKTTTKLMPFDSLIRKTAPV